MALGISWFHGVFFHAAEELGYAFCPPDARNVTVSARITKTQAAKVALDCRMQWSPLGDQRGEEHYLSATQFSLAEET